MDVKWINPFIQSFTEVMPQVGFQNVERGKLSLKKGPLKSSGIIMNLGIIGDLQGNVVYDLSLESGKKIASTMMMGAPVETLDEIAQSALTELSNMITANASIIFSNMDISTNISTPTLMHGDNFEVKLNTDQYICVQMIADGITVDVNVAIHK